MHRLLSAESHRLFLDMDDCRSLPAELTSLYDSLVAQTFLDVDDCRGRGFRYCEHAASHRLF